MKKLMIIGVLLVLTGCVSSSYTEDTVWQKSIELHPRIQVLYEEYTKMSAPGEFIVSENGRVAQWTFCREISTSGCHGGYKRQMVIKTCETKSGLKCKVYAIGRNKVVND